MTKKGGIILCGGSGTRLLPTTKYLNKHLIPIYDKPMIYYSLSILFLAGIRNITLVCNTEELQIYKNLLGEGEEFGVDISYSTQDKPEGIPHAINNALKVRSYDKFLTVLGDNFIFGEKFFTKLEQIFEETESCSIFSQSVKRPEKFGVVQVDDGNMITNIVEKPPAYISNKAVIGLYVFDNKFGSKFQNLNKSSRGEFEITDLIKEYGYENVNHYSIGRGTAWFDMGTTEDFYNTSSFVRTIQERQGLLVCSPHEICFRNNWISEENLKNYILNIEGSEYSEHLKYLFI